MNSFSILKSDSNRFTRRWAGNADGSSVDPYITGYCFIKFAHFPPVNLYLSESIATTGNPDSRNMGTQDILNFLESSVLSVTLPTGTLNKAEFPGIGGLKWAVPSYTDYDNSYSMRFLEYQGQPLYSIISSWVRLIRDYRSGTSPLTSYTKTNYAASMFYWTTIPDGRTVQTAALLTGVFPTRDPLDQYGHDITTIDKLEVDIDFNVDYVWREPWVYDECNTLAASYSEAGKSSARQYAVADSY